MDAERWSIIENVFGQAIELEPRARAALLENACSTDPELQREVERLLVAHDAAGEFLSSLDPAKSASLLNSASDAEDVQVIGRYRILRRLGNGAMGVVYLAHDPQLDRPVALKLLRARAALSPTASQRLLEEARAASALDHPNVAPVHEIGETDDGRAYIAMAYCEGESLADRIARGPLALRDALAIAQQIAEALAAAHALGIVHRDLKPANIMISADGRVRLLDFGVASMAGRSAFGEGVVVGTPGYMAPEQLHGARASTACDVWAAGVVLYEMLTAQRPFHADSVTALQALILEATPTGLRTLRRDAPRRLVNIVGQCLAKDPSSRPPNGAALAEALRGVHVRAVSTRRRALFTAAAIVPVLLLAGLWSRERNTVVPTDGELAVLPFTPLAPDTLLERVGRELAITIGASLDGVAELRVVEPIVVLSRGATSATSPDQRAALARSLGAATLVTGALVRADSLLRIDASVYDVERRRAIVHVSAAAPLHDIRALSDSFTLALLRTAWDGRLGAVVPDTTALTTGSLPALRAFLEGEQAIARSQFRAAPRSFARAIREDSSFWFAYWRYWYALSYHGTPVDSVVRARAIEHRSVFPEPDRLMVEARLAANERERLALRRAVTVRHPNHWPAWFELADQLTHEGPFLGEAMDDARAALRRATELNPGFVPAWEHRFWLSILARDTVESAQVLARLHALRLDSLLQEETSLQPLDYYGYLHQLARSGGEPIAEQADIGARVLAGSPTTTDPERAATSLSDYGFHRAQLDLSERVLRQRPRASIVAAHTWGRALAWAGRGGWDSAFVSARNYARITLHPAGSVWAYGLASTGAWLGALPPDSAAQLRAAAVRSEYGRSSDGAAELAWLDGLLACTRGDRTELERQHALLRASTSRGAPALARSLNAFGTALRGQRDEAGHALAALERENADAMWHARSGAQHPFMIGVNRLAAGRWLLGAGDTVQALQLLRLHELDLPQATHPLPTVSFILGTYALPGLARVAEIRGRTDQARHFRETFRQRADLVGTDDVMRSDLVCGRISGR